jgi:hypothetical protein
MAREFESYSEAALLDERRRYEGYYRDAQREYDDHIRRNGPGGAHTGELAAKANNWMSRLGAVDNELALRRSMR